MTKALVIDSSSRGAGSVTRSLTTLFSTQFRALETDNTLVYRDLVKSAVPHLSAETIEGFFSPQPSVRAMRATVLSDQLIEEFLAADLICIGCPVYNFNLPSALKAYIDQIVRVGKTFRKKGDGQLEGLCKGKKLLVFYSMGGMYRGTEMDFIQPYFEAIGRFMGIQQIDFIAVEGTSRAGFNQEAQLQSCATRIAEYLQQFEVKEYA